MALVTSGEDLRGAYLGIHATQNLGASLFAFGIVIAAGAVLEVIVLPVVGAATDRWGLHRMVQIGLIVGAVDYLLLGLSTDLMMLITSQAMHTVLLATVLGLDPLYLVRTLNTSRDLASSVFFAGQGAARVLAGGASITAVGALGLPHLFLLPTTAIAVVACLCALAARTPPSLIASTATHE